MRKPCRKDTARSYPVCEAVKTKKSSEGPSLLRPFSLGAKNKKSLEERMLIEKAQRKWVRSGLWPVCNGITFLLIHAYIT